jgi:cytochrome c oxidase subunit I+III
VFIGFNITFFPMHISGIMGMSRRVYTYQEEMGLGLYNMISTVGAVILTVGILVFIVNYFYSARHDDVPANPWNADSLEWATKTPAYEYGFRRLPIVHSRHPLWDDRGFSEGDEKTEKLLDLLVRWPTDWRAQLVTSIVDGKPQEVFRVAGPSIWPFVAALGVMGFSFVLIFKLYWLSVIAVALLIAGLIGWHGTDYASATRNTTLDEDFTERTGIPVRAQGSHHISMWGMGLTILTLCIGITTLTFTYFYLRLNTPVWPPANIPEPTLLLPLIAAVIMCLSAIPMRYAEHGEQDDSRPQMIRGLMGASLAALLYMGITAYDLTTMTFSFDTNAYGSIFFVINGFQFGLIATGTLMTTVTAFWLWRSDDDPANHRSTRYIARYWYFSIFALLFLYSILYLAPYS